MAMTQKEKTDYKRQFNEEKYDRIGLYLAHGEKEKWQNAATADGAKSLSDFVKKCVNEKIGKMIDK